MNKRTSQILEKAHKAITEFNGTDIPKYKRNQALSRARKILKRLKKTDPKIYNIVKKDK